MQYCILRYVGYSESIIDKYQYPMADTREYKPNYSSYYAFPCTHDLSLKNRI